MKIYSLYDKKALVYSPLMCFEDEVSAVRTAEQIVINGDTLPSKYPNDFVLVYFGDYDLKTGKFVLVDIPKSIVELANFIQRDIECER